MRFAVSIIMLGYTRIAGVVAYNSESREFEELTTAVAKSLIKDGKLKGIIWKNNENGGCFDVDTEGFNQVNIPIKTAVGKFRLLKDDSLGLMQNSRYTVVRVLETNIGKLYEVVSNKCARVKLKAENIKTLNEFNTIAGIRIKGDDIEVCEGVCYEKRTFDMPDDKLGNIVCEEQTEKAEQTEQTEQTEKAEQTEQVEEVKEEVKEVEKAEEKPTARSRKTTKKKK